MKALIVFYAPEHSGKWDWALKKNFKHCFVCINDGQHWIVVDGWDGRPVVKVIQAAAYDLKTFYEYQEGYSVIEVSGQEKPLRPFPILASCVGITKALLCISAPWVFTPWQLYKYLKA